MNITDILKTLAPIQLKSIRNTIDTLLKTTCINDDNELLTVENWFIAIEKGDIDAIKIFIKYKFDINTKDSKNGNTAIFKIQDDTTKFLIDAGADINIQNNYGNTALILASQSSLYESVKLLLDAGADMSIKNKNGNTALTSCSSNIIGNSIRTLLKDTQIKVKDLSDISVLKRIKRL